jgi:hypothetical protein
MNSRSIVQRILMIVAIAVKLPTLAALTVLAIAVALGLVRTAQPVQAATTWNVGDVFAGVGGGAYNVYDNNGVFKETINQGLSGFTTGCSFNPDLTKLYTTNFTNTKVVVFNDPSPHSVVQTINTITPGASASSESIVFAADGQFYVGHADGDRDVKRYNPSGVFQQAYNVATEVGGRGSDWIDLAADQTTLFYTSEGRRILRYNVSGAGTQLPDFATLPGTVEMNRAFALRILPPGDGSGGLMVADTSNIKRLNGVGVVAQTYDALGEDAWFSLSLDPNGTSFWAGDQVTNNFYRFNIATGAVEVGPIQSGGSLFGLCLKGEITAAEPTPRECIDTDPETGPCEHTLLVFTGVGPQPETQIAVFTNNSEEITTNVNAFFVLPVHLIGFSPQALQRRFEGTPFEGWTCNPSFPHPTNVCAVIRVDGRTVDRDFYGSTVALIMGWDMPPITGDPDDYHLLRAPGYQSSEDTGVPGLFTQDITDFVCPNYVPVFGCEGPPADGGVGGDTDGFSDYVVALENGDDDDGNGEDDDGDDDDFDDDDEQDDGDDDDDGDGEDDDDDADDDNDGEDDDDDGDDDNDGINDGFDSESTKEVQNSIDDDVEAGGEDNFTIAANTGTLLLTAAAYAFQVDPVNQWLRVEIYDPNGTLLAVSPPTPGWAVAAAVPVLPGTYRVRVRNLSGGQLSYRTLLITRRNWLPGEALQ